MLVPDRDAPGGARAVLLDFGLAKVLRDEPGLVGLTRSGFTIGTPEFMSPEQVMGKELDWRSDLYALGILAFEMFTGRVPFEGKTPNEVTLARLQGQPRQLRALRPESIREARERDRPGPRAAAGGSLRVHGSHARSLRVDDGEDGRVRETLP